VRVGVKVRVAAASPRPHRLWRLLPLVEGDLVPVGLVLGVEVDLDLVRVRVRARVRARV